MIGVFSGMLSALGFCIYRDRKRWPDKAKVGVLLMVIGVALFAAHSLFTVLK